MCRSSTSTSRSRCSVSWLPCTPSLGSVERPQRLDPREVEVAEGEHRLGAHLLRHQRRVHRRSLVGEGEHAHDRNTALRERSQRARRRTRDLRHRSRDRLLPRRLLQHRPPGRRQPHDLRGRDRRVPRPPARDRQRPRDAAAGVPLRGADARRPLVRDRGQLGARLPGGRGRVRRPRRRRTSARSTSCRWRRCASSRSTSPPTRARSATSAARGAHGVTRSLYQALLPFRR